MSSTVAFDATFDDIYNSSVALIIAGAAKPALNLVSHKDA